MEFICTTTAGPGTFTVPASVLTQVPKVAASAITAGTGIGSLSVISTTTPGDVLAFFDGRGDGLPHYSGFGSFGDRIVFAFEWHVSVFDRPAELSRPPKLTAISVAGCARIHQRCRYHQITGTGGLEPIRVAGGEGSARYLALRPFRSGYPTMCQSSGLRWCVHANDKSSVLFSEAWCRVKGPVVAESGPAAGSG